MKGTFNDWIQCDSVLLKLSYRTVWTFVLMHGNWQWCPKKTNEIATIFEIYTHGFKSKFHFAKLRMKIDSVPGEPRASTSSSPIATEKNEDNNCSLDLTPHPASGLLRNANESEKDSNIESETDDTDTGEGSDASSEDRGEPAGDHWTTVTSRKRPSRRSPTPIPTQNEQIPETKKQVKRDLLLEFGDHCTMWLSIEISDFQVPSSKLHWRRVDSRKFL